jgi:hypothetical protein
LIAAIEAAEAEKAALEAALARPDVYKDGEKTRETRQKLAAAAAQIAELEKGWGEL